jgi:hypothetical protein
MLRDPDRPTEDGKYSIRTFIAESAKEMQEAAKALPETADLPTTHEHYVRHFRRERNGVELSCIEVGVRPKAGAAPAQEPDGLNQFDDAQLEVEAAKAGVKDYPKGQSKAKRIAVIREARKAKG